MHALVIYNRATIWTIWKIDFELLSAELLFLRQSSCAQFMHRPTLRAICGQSLVNDIVYPTPKGLTVIIYHCIDTINRRLSIYVVNVLHRFLVNRLWLGLVRMFASRVGMGGGGGFESNVKHWFIFNYILYMSRTFNEVANRVPDWLSDRRRIQLHNLTGTQPLPLHIH